MNYSFRNLFKLHKIRKELKEVYANQMVDNLAHSIVMVFIPIYLMKIGYSLTESLLVLLVVEVTAVVFSVPIASLASRIGLKHTILYRIPVAIILILWLETLPFIGIHPANLLVVGMIWGLSRVLYWIPLNSEFVDNSDRIHRGEEVGFLIALPIIVSVGSPFAGGVILELLGFYVLFSIFIVLMAVSVVPFFLTHEFRKHFRFKMENLDFRLANRFRTGFFSQGFIMIGEYLLWPLYIYTVFNNAIFTGIVASLSSLGAAFLTLLIGRVCDRIRRDKMLRLGVLGCFFVWVLRFLAVTEMEFFILSFLGGIFMVLVLIPMFASFSDSAKGRNIVNDVSMREIFIGLGRIALLSMIIVSSIGLKPGMLVIAAFSLLLLLTRVGPYTVVKKSG